MNPTLRLVFIILFFVGMALVVLSRFYIYFEQLYANKHHKPFFLNRALFWYGLTDKQERVLKQKFTFYNRLSPKEQRVFRHRVAKFLRDKEFITRDNLELTDEIRVLISATAMMLTFGFKDYLIDILSVVVVYPKPFYSKTNETYHKGEMNPKLGTIVFSWEDFEEGYDISNDNLNLGVHEFGHAIHLNSFSNDDISAMIFNNGFLALKTYLKDNEPIRQKLIKSKYFRAYAYTNQFEFVAVLMENFIETPQEFRTQFPEVYGYMKRMLNFNFAGY
ncbi:MAG: zinc-dependent peptidase [Bacteroidota bacterium]